MRPSKARFVTACQQLLALGVVLAVLTPAAGIISIDVVGETPGAAPGDHVSPVTCRRSGNSVCDRPLAVSMTNRST